MKWSAVLFLICNLFALSTTNLNAQKQTNIWYFGLRAGLDFNSGTPTPLTNSLMATNEGCASIADNTGNLLFYTNGVYVWNREHQQMPGGFGLMGHRSSSQSAIIVPKPGDQKLYYIFTTDLQSQAYGMRYSVVDITKSSNTGDVVEKNVFLTSPITEKITAVQHQNGRDFWVIAHKWDSDAFVSFLITPRGVSKFPVISRIGSVHKGKSKGAIGCMKASPDGRKIAVAIWRDINRFEVFDFNNNTGGLTNRLHLEPYPEAYGVEFSPDGSKLYGTTNGIGKAKPQLWQFNLRAGSNVAIASSAVLISTETKHKIGALQLGPDGRIYLAKENDNFLGVIQNPNAPGWSCRYLDQGMSLGTRQSKLGLPNFVQSYFNNLSPLLNSRQ